MNKTIILLITFILLLISSTFGLYDYTTATPTQVNLPQYNPTDSALININDGNTLTYFFSNGGVDGGYFQYNLGTNITINRIFFTNISDSSGASYPFQFEVFLGQPTALVSVYNYSYDGGARVNINESVSETVSSIMRVVFQFDTTTEAVQIFEAGFYEKDGFIDNNLTITLDYPSNNTIFYGDFLNQINVTLSNVNGTANCSIYNDTRWTVSGYDFGNETVTFINNTVIIETNFTYQIDCYDIDNYYNLTGAWFIKYNVLNISIYDDTTGDLINVSVSMNLYNDDYYQTYETTNGTIYITGLSNGTYSADFSSENYSSRGYTLTLGFGEITNLNAYLSSVDGEVILTTRDRETGAIIQGATITVKKFIDSVLTTIYTKDTDITGRIQFGYTTGVKYYFTVTKTGYENKEFILDPVIFSEYSVYLDSTATITDESDFAGVSILHTPTIFYEGMNNITVTISNPDGALINYGFNYTYLGNINGSSGSNAYGSTLQDTFNISGSSWGDKVRLTIYYRLNGESIKSYIYNYEIIPAPSNNTFMYNQNKHYGLGEFERVSIFTLMTVFIGGMFTIFTGAVSGFGVMLLMMGYFVKIGFISLWYVVIPIFAGAIILIWRVSQ